MKTTNKNTIGPWAAIAKNPPTVMDRRGCRIATTCQLPGHSADEQQANARLIASAPDLLDALEEIFHDWITLVGEDLREENEDVSRIWEKCEIVLAKAKGEA
jgi:hypothetical protein